MIKKFLYTIAISMALLLIMLAVLPLVFKDKLTNMARQEINAKVNAHVGWSDMGVSAFRNFPSISVYIKNLVVVNDTPFAGDTLAHIGELIVSVNPLKLVNGKQVDVSAIIINEPKIYIQVAKNGDVNYNILKPDTSTASVSPDTTKSAGYKVSLRKFNIKNARFIYDDREDNIYTELDGLTNKLSGNFSSNEFELKDKGNVEGIIVRYGKVTYLNKVKVSITLAMDINQAQNKYRFKNSSVRLNDLALALNGGVTMVNDTNITADLAVEAKEPDFKHLISLLPAVYSKDFKNVKTSGTLDLKAYAKGHYNGISYPAFGVNLAVGNASFQYPGLPAAVTGINIDVKAKNPGGSLDNTVVDVDNFSLNLAGDPFKMQLHVINPVLDPEITASVSGHVDLGSVKNYYPLNGDQLTGKLNLEINAKGKLSAIEKEQYQDFDASGTLEATDIKYQSKELPKNLHLSEMKMTFKPELVSLDAFTVRMGKSDFSATGELDNLFNYLFSKSVLKGKLKLNSKLVDLDELMAPEMAQPAASTNKPAAASTSPTVQKSTGSGSLAIQVPKNIDFTVDAYAEKVLYSNVVLDSVAGELLVRNETVTLNGLQAKAFDGNMVLDGDYTTLNTENPHVDMKVNLSMVSVEKAVAGLENTLSMLPSLKAMEGVLSTVLNVKTELDRQLQPKMKTMVADGRIDVHHLAFHNKKTDDIAEHTKLGILKFIRAKDFFTNIKVAKGNLYVEPFNLPMGKINLTIYGSHDLTDSNSGNYNMLVDAPADSTGKSGKHKRYKVGINGNQSNNPTIHEATGDDDTVLQNATTEQQNLVDAAGHAKSEAENNVLTEKQKRQQAAATKAQKRADRLKAQAEQKAKDQVNSGTN